MSRSEATGSKRRRQEDQLDPGTETPDSFWADMDPDGSMSERPDYWRDLPPPEPPTRLAWLRHRARAAADLLRTPAPEPDPWMQPRVPEEEWIRLSEQALGPLPRQADIPQERKARSAAPNARQHARKPVAYSPKATAV
ncbi:hypothetical protein [Ramlibacter sp.]|uniref:hypothetical protein n=1 Tax=Ramlibacter sp. TaxID=1917967 RepID=UPI003D0995DC